MVAASVAALHATGSAMVRAIGRRRALCTQTSRALLGAAAAVGACGGGGASTAPRPQDAGTTASLPLALVADVPLPGRPVRFDYQDVDVAKGHLVIAHMNDASVVVTSLADGSVVKVVPHVPTARGVAVADDVGRIFVTSSPNQLVVIDNDALTEIARVTTGNAPDGVGWDPKDRMVGVSDQHDGAVSLIADAGEGQRRAVSVGVETGNVVYDAPRGRFWVTAVQSSPPDQLVAIDPVAATVLQRIPLPGCDGAHGLRIHPDGNSALVACENDDRVARVALDDPAHAIVTAASGAGPDVLAIDSEYGWLYVAAESGDMRVFDLRVPGLTAIDAEHPGDNSHTVAVDPATHRVFFPLPSGPDGTPVLRIMRPAPVR